jgi:hypothetical protein
MSLSQRLNEFRFNLETLDLMMNMGRTTEQAVSMLKEIGFSQQLINFISSQRNILNMVMIRLQLYSENNMNESSVKSSFSSLNNSNINYLMDYLFHSDKQTKKQTPPPTPKEVQHKEPVVASPVYADDDHQEEDNQEDEDNQEEESHFDSFFSEHVRVSDDSTDVIKMSAMYDCFTKWWSNNHEDEVPSKDELKDFLSQKLGRTIKSTISNVLFA